VDHAVVEPDHPVRELGLAKARARPDHVHRPAVHLEGGVDAVEVAVPPAPEVQALHLGRRTHDPGLPCAQCGLCAGPGLDGLALHVLDPHLQAEGPGLGVLIADLGLHVDRPGPGPHVQVLGVHVHTQGPQVRVQGQGLVEPVRHVEPDVLVDAPVVGVEVPVRPLIPLVRGLLAVVPGVVDPDCQDVLLGPGPDRVRDVEAEGHDPVLMASQVAAVEVELARLAHALELQEDLAGRGIGRQPEVLAVPGHARGELGDGDLEGRVLVPGVGQCHDLPPGVVEVGRRGPIGVSDPDPPAWIEVVCGAGRGRRGETGLPKGEAAPCSNRDQDHRADDPDRGAMGPVHLNTSDTEPRPHARSLL